MKLTYDPKYNSGYIAFRDKTAQVQTLHISDELNIDMAPDGTIYGIELLNANEQLIRNTTAKTQRTQRRSTTMMRLSTIGSI